MDVHRIVEEQLGKNQISLEKNLGLQFQITNGKIEQVIEKVDKINGRVGKAEGHIRGLQDVNLNRIENCPFSTDIKTIRKKLIEDSGIETYIRLADEKREKQEVKRNRILMLVLASITLFLGGLTFLFNYFIR